ncbi:hypothetical protein BH09CHL1_BH09CHL1_18300 [soil metagenome]
MSCELSEHQLAARTESILRPLFAGVRERRAIENGVEYRFSGDDSWKARLYEFVDAERTCCSFIRIELAFEPGFGPIWLRLSGDDTAQAFIADTFDALVNLGVRSSESSESPKTIRR